MVAIYHHLNCWTVIYATDAKVLRYRNFIWSPTKIYPRSHTFWHFFNGLFLFIKNKDVASYADNTTSYETGGNSTHFIHNLEVLVNTLLNWFNDNSRKANRDKDYLLLSGNDASKVTIGNETIPSSKLKKLLGIKIYSNVNFKEHIESLCKNSSQKIHVLSRLPSSMNFEQRRLIMNSFVIFTFHTVQLCGCSIPKN